MTDAQPCERYKIKIKGQLGYLDGVRSRDVWNSPWTGTFLAYDQHVEEATKIEWAICLHCDDGPFEVTQKDIDAASGVVNCEHCDEPCDLLLAGTAVYRTASGWRIELLTNYHLTR